jgi:putative nucleotidyltransferase with HDIG domain
MKKNMILQLISAGVFILAYLFMFTPGRPAFDFEIRVGENLPEGIVSPVEFDVPLPEEEYEQKKDETAALVPVYLRSDPDIERNVEESVFSYLQSQVEDSMFVQEVARKLATMYEKGVFDLGMIRQVYSGEHAVLVSDSSETLITLASLHHLEEVGDDLTLTLRGGRVSWSVIGSSVMLLEPNIILDTPARSRAIEFAVEMVSSVDTTLYPGDTLITPGGVVTDQSMRMLEALRQSDSGLTTSRRMRYLAGRALLVIGLSLLGLFYVRDQMKDTWTESRKFLLLATIWLPSLAATGLIWMFLRTVYGPLLGSFVTLGAALTSIFFDRRHATVITMLFALALGAVHPHPFTFVLITFTSGTLAAYFVWDLRRRSSVPRSITAASVGGLLAWGVMVLLTSDELGGQWLGTALELVLAPVIGVGVATSVLLPLEKAFGVYTVLAIDEVKDRHHPLLEQLSRKAMGTWQHSQAVADLASEAARAIGADTDLAEAGGLFHDIGKMNAPEFFIENLETGTKNPHESMSTLESAGIIIEHVRDGVEMARKHRLPDSLVSVIEQHHGDCTTRYFLEKARGLASDSASVDTSFYSYKGPKPETTEAAIVMMADSVSSAVQALREITPEKVTETVKRIIEEKDNEGQFDECHITRAQIRKVGEVFLQVLRGRFHERVIDYPHGSNEPDA